MNKPIRVRECLLLVPVLLSACAIKPRPPVFNLYAHTKAAVLPFRNGTKDAALAGDLRDALVAEIRRLDAVPLSDAAAPPETSASPWTDAAWRKGVVDATGCDLILAGMVGNYTETLKAEDPKRVKSRMSFGYRWGWADQGTVHLDATVVLVDARTGEIVWHRTVPSDGKQGRWTDLGWPGDTTGAPAEGWDALKAQARPATAAPGPDGLLYPVEPLVGGARTEAIAETVRALSTDFLGRDGWEPPAKAAPAPK